ncbi:MAG TPA: cell envelope integrity protein TolA [Spongiibacteraceae bacterium]
MARPVAIPLTVSLLLHLAVLVMLALNFTFSAEPKVLPPQPKIIEAKLISMEQMPAAKAQPKPVEAPPQPTPEPAKPVDVPKPEPSKTEPIKPTPEPLKPELPKPDLEKLKQIEKQKQLEKEKADAAQLAEQKKLAEQKNQETERKRKEAEEAQRKQQQDDQARKLRAQQEKNELAKAMAAEDNAIAAERDQEAVASYAGLVQRDIQSNWSRPPSARIGMRVTLLIQLIPSGDVVNVSVLKSSGNDAFDQSAQNAVRRVAKFPYLKELADKSPAAFEKNFRRLQLDFTPEDLRQ